MPRNAIRVFFHEDLTAGLVALVAVSVCALALFDVPAASATRGVSYTEFVRAPAVEVPAEPVLTPAAPDRPRMAELPLEVPAAELAVMPLSCSPDTRAELQRLLALCRG